VFLKIADIEEKPTLIDQLGISDEFVASSTWLSLALINPKWLSGFLQGIDSGHADVF
jgi:hypothetical protein